MKKVERNEILDYVTYSEQRDKVLEKVLPAKAARRIHVGEHLTFLFENADTVRYQIQEMIRVEQIVKEADIQHEIDTYNELLPAGGSLGCTLLIEIETPEKRNELLREWMGLPNHLYAKLEDGTKVRPTFDDRQVGDERLSSVQYLTFELGGKTPVALGADLEALTEETALSDEQRAALGADLQG